jgi:hypothetical protein
VGRVQRRGEDYLIEPLTLPVLSKDGTGDFQVPPEWQKAFEGAALRECLAAYVNRYREIGGRDHKRRIVYDRDSFLDRCKPASGGIADHDLWRAEPRVNAQLQLNAVIPARIQGLHVRRKHLIGQDLRAEPRQCTERRAGDIEGCLRVLGIEDRDTELPTKNKKHELFIPRPTTPREPIPIPPPVLERFARLLLDRAREDDKYPFFPKGYERYRPDKDQLAGKTPWRPAHGMLLFFDIEDTPEGLRVKELSFSSIWRREVPGNAYDYFKKIDPDLLPWGTSGRTGLTPAEALFGAVEQQKQETQGRNLASRLRFHDALPEYQEGQDQVRLSPAVTLKTLGSPKPPSPALYFHPEGQRGTYVSKSALNAEIHRPNGRKVYLHHPREQIDAAGWQSLDTDPANNKLKLCCRPIAAGEVFWFHIDFDNLTRAELALVGTALRPSEDFRHRLGLGKPLGLGTVEASVEAVMIVDRKARYGPELENMKDRYRPLYCRTGGDPQHWPPRYRQTVTAEAIAGASALNALLNDRSLIDETTFQQLLAAGESGRLEPGVPVHPPLTENQLPRDTSRAEQIKLETEHFRWFVANDLQGGAIPQALPGLSTSRDQKLTPLYTWVTLVVQGLPRNATKEALRARFEEVVPGQVHDVKIGKKHGTAKVIVLASAARRAIQALNHQPFARQEIRIVEGKP